MLLRRMEIAVYSKIVIGWMRKNNFTEKQITSIIEEVAKELEKERLEREFKNCDGQKPGRA